MNLTEQQLDKAIYSFWDFQQALSALTFLLEECNFEEKYNRVELRRFKCFESTAIISMSRPLGQTRNGITLGLRAIGIALDEKEKSLIKTVLEHRDLIVAHSAEEEMHFKTSTFLVEGGMRFPHFQFNEGLLFEYDVLLELEKLLIKLKNGLADFFLKVAQTNPALLEKYKEPNSFKGSSA